MARVSSASSGNHDDRSLFPFLGVSACPEPSRQEFVAFFQDRVAGYTGGSRNYDTALERMRLREARWGALAADVAHFFSQQ